MNILFPACLSTFADIFIEPPFLHVYLQNNSQIQKWQKRNTKKVVYILSEKPYWLICMYDISRSVAIAKFGRITAHLGLCFR